MRDITRRKTQGLAALLGALALAACTTRNAHLTMPDYEFAAPPPAARPASADATPRLVSYPGIEVEYVANADADTYHYRGSYYTFFDGDWFRARSLSGPWTYVEMKYVPSDLFRVRGHRPPALVDR